MKSRRKYQSSFANTIMKVHLATDHAGLDLKNTIKEYLLDNGYDVTDHGAH